MIRQEPSAYGRSGASARLVSVVGFPALVGYRNGFGIVAITAGAIVGPPAATTWILEIQPNCSPAADWLPMCQLESAGALPPGIDVRTRWLAGVGPNGGKRVEVYMINALGGAAGGAGWPSFAGAFASMGPDNPAPIAAGAPIALPNSGPHRGGAVADGVNAITLPVAGIYRVTAQASFTADGQISIWSQPGGAGPFAELTETVSGHGAAADSVPAVTPVQAVIDTFIQVTAGTVLQVRVATGSAPITLTANAGGADSVIATFTAELQPTSATASVPFSVASLGASDAVLFHLEEPGPHAENSV